MGGAHRSTFFAFRPPSRAMPPSGLVHSTSVGARTWPRELPTLELEPLRSANASVSTVARRRFPFRLIANCCPRAKICARDYDAIDGYDEPSSGINHLRAPTWHMNSDLKISVSFAQSTSSGVVAPCQKMGGILRLRAMTKGAPSLASRF